MEEKWPRDAENDNQKKKKTTTISQLSAHIVMSYSNTEDTPIPKTHD